LGPVFAVVGLVTYFTVAVNFPGLRDSALLNLVIVCAGVAVALWGLARRRNWKSWIGAGGAVGVAGLLFWYVFAFSAEIPGAELAARVGTPAPALVLPDHSGRTVDLAEMGDRRTVVVFYRGFW
jgi:hypothetical protein